MMRIRQKALALLVCGAAVVPLSRPARAWQTFVDDLPNANGEAVDVVVDPSQDVLAVGTIADFTAVKLSGESGAEIWRQTLTGTAGTTGEPRAVAAAPDGDAIVAGSAANATTLGDFLVARLDAATGSPVWRQDLNGSSGFGEAALDVTVDASGDILAAGRLENTGSFWDFTVVKLAGSSGTLIWSYERDGSAGVSEEARALVVNESGDVFAVGFVRNASTGSDLMVVKLGGTLGSELWRREIDGGVGRTDEGLAIALDEAGDVVVAGFVTKAGTSRDLVIYKLSADSGATLWSFERDGGASGDDRAVDVAFGPSGRVFAAGRLTGATSGADAAVLALDGATGASLWTYVLDGPASGFDEALGVSPGPAGDPVWVGFVSDPHSGRDLVAARLDAASGSELWRQVLNGSADGSDFAGSVTPIANGEGDVVLAGAIWRMTRRGPIRTRDPSREFTVIRLEGSDGSDLRMTAGRSLSLVDRNTFESRQLLRITSDDPLPLVPPVRGSPSDPRPLARGGSGGGGRIVLRNPTTGETDILDLPAENWDVIGTDRNPRGYRYRDTDLSSGPCRFVVLRAGRRLFANCLGGGISFSLNEPRQETLATMISLGQTPASFCMEFGGELLADFPIGGFFNRGKFKARNAPPPEGCAANVAP